MKGYLDDIDSAAHSDLPWSALNGCRILVAGATGLIGSCLVRVLMSRNAGEYSVYAMGRNEERGRRIFCDLLNLPCFHFVRQDVTDVLPELGVFDFIIDAASGASPSVYVSDPVSVVRDNIYGVDNLLSYGSLHNMRRFLYVSSGEIYGEGDGRPFTENHSGYVDTMSSRSCYPSSKRAAETLAVAYSAQFGLDVVVARPCHVFGPCFTENDNRAYAEFLRKALRGDDIVLKSDGGQYRSWCYVVDCASALLHILLKGESREAYNIADSGSCLSILELAGLIADIASVKVVFDAPSDGGLGGVNPVRRSVFSDDKLRGLGWTPANDIRTNLEHTYRYLNDSNQNKSSR